MDDRRPIRTVAPAGTITAALGDPGVWLRETRERAVAQRANGYHCDCADCWSRSEQAVLDFPQTAVDNTVGSGG